MKWQKEVFEAVEIDTSQPPLVFKAQLYALSGVPPERQKIMVKGGMLKVQKTMAKLVKLNKININIEPVASTIKRSRISR